MLQEQWDSFQHFSYRVSAILALITNSILVNLILYHSPKSLGTYKYLMICICVFEVLYELLDLAASPEMYTNNSVFLVIVSEKKSLFPLPMLFAVNLAYCACFGTSLAIFAVHFIYRYLVVIGNKEWTVQSLRNILFWLTAPLLFGSVWTLTVLCFISPEPYLDRLLSDEMMIHYGVSVNNLSYFGPYLYPLDGNGEATVNWKAIHGMILFVIMIVISLTTMAFFGIKSYVRINKSVTRTSRSTNFRTLQTQLLLALIFQTIIPLTLMHFPLSFCFLLPFFVNSKVIFGRIVTFSIAIYPVVDPLPNMFLIKNYRKGIILFWRKMFRNTAYLQKRASSDL